MNGTKKRLWRGALLLAASISLLALPVMGCTPDAETETVVFGDLQWDSALVNNRIAAFILEHGYGYTDIEYIPGDTVTIFQGLVRGDVHINMEIWVENQQEAWDASTAAGDILDLGTNFDDNWQGWLVPRYVVEGDPDRGIEPMAPDLRSVFDMPEYWELFKDPEDPSKGRFVNGIPGWEATGINSDKLAAYGLDEYFTDFLAGSDAALSGSMAGAYERGQPWFGYYWAPTAALGRFDMYPLEEPAFDQEIWETTRACAYPSNNVNVSVNAEFAERNPDVVEFLRNYRTETAQHNAVLAYLSDEGATHEEAAMHYLREYEDWWTQWVPSDVAAAVKAAL